MNFISITQYLNKLQILFMILLIFPLFTFIALHFTIDEQTTEPRIAYFAVIPALAVLDWIIGAVMFNKKIKSVRNQQGLGAKLEKYFGITTVRYCFVSSSSLILCVGFFLTGSDVFTALYFLILLLSTLLWPTGPRVSRDLMLRGDEREMVYFRRDKLS